VQSKIAITRDTRLRKKKKSSVAELTHQQAGPETEIMFVSHRWGSRAHSPVYRLDALPTTRVARSLEPLNPDDDAKSPSKQKKPSISSGTRCGVFWDDAAVKCGEECTGGIFGECNAYGGGDCFADLPFCDHDYPAGKCYGIKSGVSDTWCVDSSRSIDGNAPSATTNEDFYKMCVCDEVIVGLNTETEPPPFPRNASSMPEKSNGLVDLVKYLGNNFAGLPDCTWKPQKGCTNVTQYECLEGPKQGECSGTNWYYKPNECSSSCVHTILLNPAPYYAVWRTGPRALPWPKSSRLPHYAPKDTLGGDPIRKAFASPQAIFMSEYCKSDEIEFVGVSLFSPAYEAKARRLLDSCNKLGVCCKATEVRSDYLGPSAPEGSDEFRFRTIAAKPMFLLDQLERTKEPVVFLDVDLEFHRYPELFLPDSWPDGPRDVALFNFWANETNVTYRHTPNIGSAVAFFNSTYRAKKLLIAWAEAMKFDTNPKAPDDQVLDKLLNEGSWMSRVSLGWLPSSYLRNMPAYYRGVLPVIDHDHGTAPGVAGHAMLKPKLPPVLWWEPVEGTKEASARDR
jgi:hypothetical protein